MLLSCRVGSQTSRRQGYPLPRSPLLNQDGDFTTLDGRESIGTSTMRTAKFDVMNGASPSCYRLLSLLFLLFLTTAQAAEDSSMLPTAQSKSAPSTELSCLMNPPPVARTSVSSGTPVPDDPAPLICRMLCLW